VKIRDDKEAKHILVNLITMLKNDGLSESEVLTLKDMANRFVRLVRVDGGFREREPLRSKGHIREIVIRLEELYDISVDNPDEIIESLLNRGVIEERERDEKESILVSAEEFKEKKKIDKGYYITQKGLNILNEYGYEIILIEYAEAYNVVEYGRSTTKGSITYEYQALTKKGFNNLLDDLKSDDYEVEANWEKKVISVYDDF